MLQKISLNQHILYLYVSNDGIKNKIKIGVVGLGNMGGNIALHLLDLGYSVVGFDVNKAKYKAFRKITNFHISGTLLSCIEDTNVCFFSLPSGNDVKDAILSINRKGFRDKIIVDLTTSSIQEYQLIDSLSSKLGLLYLPCKLGGGPDQARRGRGKKARRK